MKNKIHNFDSFVKSDYSVNEGAFLNEVKISTSSPAADYIRDVSAPELVNKIKKLWKSLELWNGDRKEANKPIFIYGAPGIGKTQLVDKAANELGIKVLNMDLQFMAPEDFIGIPKVVKLTDEDIDKLMAGRSGNKISKEEWLQRMKSIGAGATRGNPPLVLPRNNLANGLGGILFMDEANRAKPRVLNSLLGFVQQGRIGDYHLPSRWVIVAAGNRPTNDEADVATFDFAFADRFDIVNYDPKPEDWVNWAKEQASTPDFSKWPVEIISYLQKNPDKLHHLDPEQLAKADGMGAKFRTHRSWTAALNHIANTVELEGKDSWKDLDFQKVMNIIRDKVGLTGMTEMKAYLNTLRQLSEDDLRQIYTDPENAKLLPRTIPDDPGYSLLTTLFGLYDIVKKELEDEHGSPPPVKYLYNIMYYFNRYKQHEVLTSLYQRMKKNYPIVDLKRESDILNAVKDPKDPRHEDAVLVVKIAGLVKEVMPEGVMPSQPPKPVN